LVSRAQVTGKRSSNTVIGTRKRQAQCPQICSLEVRTRRDEEAQFAATLSLHSVLCSSAGLQELEQSVGVVGGLTAAAQLMV
jgi:hypothetical protein